MRVKCHAQEHNKMSPTRARARTARSGVEFTNHEATAPPTLPIGSIHCSDTINVRDHCDTYFPGDEEFPSTEECPLVDPCVFLCMAQLIIGDFLIGFFHFCLLGAVAVCTSENKTFSSETT